MEKEYPYPIFSPSESPSHFRRNLSERRYSANEQKRNPRRTSSHLTSSYDSPSAGNSPVSYATPVNEHTVFQYDGLVPLEMKTPSPCSQPPYPPTSKTNSTSSPPPSLPEDVEVVNEAPSHVTRTRTNNDHRPSFAELQKEDRFRRPSVNVYQSVDNDHPDLIHIQALVEKLNFGEYDK